MTVTSIPVPVKKARYNLKSEQSVDAALAKMNPAKAAQIRKASKDFEAMFLSQMLKPMFAGVKSDSMFGGGKAENIYRSMMIQQYGKEISNAGGVGIAKEVQRELISLQQHK